MTARTVFLASLCVSTLLGLSLPLLFDPKPPMSDFKRAGTKTAAAAILGEWGPDGLALARRNFAVDALFILAYSTMWISGALYLGPIVDPRLRVPAMVFAGTGIAGALCDIVENACLYRMLYGNASESAPRLCSQVAPLNAGLYKITAVYFLIACAVAVYSRWRG